MSIRCVTFRVLVKPHDVLEKDDAYAAAKRMGLDLSLENKLSREQAAVDQATVVDFGPTVFKDYGVDNPIKVGDTVVYAKHAGKKVVDPEDKVEYLVLNDEDIVCILENGA